MLLVLNFPSFTLKSVSIKNIIFIFHCIELVMYLCESDLQMFAGVICSITSRLCASDLQCFAGAA